MAEIVGKSKFEIMVTLMKALNVSSFDFPTISAITETSLILI